MATIKVKLIKSPVGKPESQRKVVEALGFRKVNQVIEKNDTPQIRGMINKINFMVEIID
ncbi:50S ribosomal protein L30 [Soehngenia longivitae]|jgi:large subunit ribosomal protein L30|uniref:Large ribosomal subunit protein uL30 n=1 Tax=Soehngenia longivitae TaxID=2562294 RepID=A0A4Z0DAC5_9FIRM|nr:50S ribosomal protein L30 [Soehngenia longivitae]TFZ41834.1 50S ribosomal protein L30 [Soehngenia longivitae]